LCYDDRFYGQDEIVWRRAVMERTTARERFAEDAVMFPVDVSGVSEESGREALEALRKAVAGRRRIRADEERG
jgi:hypothetical protein